MKLNTIPRSLACINGGRCSKDIRQENENYAYKKSAEADVSHGYPFYAAHFHSGNKKLNQSGINTSDVLKKQASCWELNQNDCSSTLLQDSCTYQLCGDHNYLIVQSVCCKEIFQKKGNPVITVQDSQESDVSCTHCNAISSRGTKVKLNSLRVEDEDSLLSLLKAKVREKNNEIDELKMKIVSLEDKLKHIQSFHLDALKRVFKVNFEWYLNVSQREQLLFSFEVKL